MTERIHFRPGQVCRWSPPRSFELDGRPVFIVGTNYVARYVCTNFWEDWRPEVIAKDLDNIAAAGLNSVRIPVPWEYAEPRPGVFRPEMEKRLAAFYTMAEERGLFVMPWFLVGVATQNYDVSWREGRSFFREPMRTYAAEHVRHFVRLLKDRPNVLCWDICDEPEGYSQHKGADPLPYERGLVEAWTKQIAEAIRGEDPHHTVTLGHGPTASADFGISVRDWASILDVMCTTAYPHWMNRELLTGLRNSHFLGFHDRMNDLLGKGVFTAEAPGYSDVAASEAVIAGFYRQTLYSNLANGSTAVQPWVWNDFDPVIHQQAPIETANLETSFGIARADGTLKPAGEVLADFAQTMRQLDVLSWQPERADVTIVITEDYVANTGRLWQVMFNAYLMARQAGLFPRFVWERDLASALASQNGSLVIVPSEPHLLTSTWYTLAGSVERGTTMLCCFAGQLAFPWRRLFGVEAVGTEMARPENLSLPESSIQLHLPGGLGRLTLNAESAEVVARSQDGALSVTRNRYGHGQAILLNYPLEQAMGGFSQDEIEAFQGFRLYAWAAAQAGLTPMVAAGDPRVEVAAYSKGNELLLLAVNHSGSAVKTTVFVNAAGADVSESALAVRASCQGRATMLDLELEPAAAGHMLLRRPA